MEVILLIGILVTFGLMVALNVYFRIKIIRHYKVLQKQRIQFGSAHIFNREKLETEIVARHPEFAEHIYGFSTNLKHTIRMTSVLLALITLFGAVLMYWR